MILLAELKKGNRFHADVLTDNKLAECEVVSIKDNAIISRFGIGQSEVNPVNALPIMLSVAWLMGHKFDVTIFNDATYPHGPVLFNLYAKTGVDGWYEDSSFTIKCDYVHQLQNAYKKVTGADFPMHPL